MIARRSILIGLAALAATAIITPAVAQEYEGVDWVSVSIATGQTSEYIFGATFKTRAECEAFYMHEARSCIPVAALPDSYWQAVEAEGRAACHAKTIFREFCDKHGHAFGEAE